jgi:hypothetical protein
MANALRQLKQALGALQTAWSIFGITLVAIVLAESGFRLSFAVKDQMSSARQPDPRVLAEGYGGAAWPVEHYRELESLADRWEPYVYFRQKPFRGKTITIGPDGLRTTWQPPQGWGESTRSKNLKVLILGGSSLWGFGARDDQTIPSLLVRELFERGWRIDLKNLSEIGYVSTQEVIALVRELQGGYRPDVVIFYDGVNDTTSALLEREAGLTTNEVNRRQEFNLLQSPSRLALAFGSRVLQQSGSYRFGQAVRRRFSGGVDRSRQSPSDNTIGQFADDVVRRYAANLSIVGSLSRSFRFRPLFFWQPVVFTKTVLVPAEREEALRYAWTERLFRSVRQRIGDSAELKANPAFRDLSAVFDDAKNLVFIDYCHTTEAANRPIAVAMADAVIDAMKKPLAEVARPRRAGVDLGILPVE